MNKLLHDKGSYKLCVLALWAQGPKPLRGGCLTAQAWRESTAWPHAASPSVPAAEPRPQPSLSCPPMRREQNGRAAQNGGACSACTAEAMQWLPPLNAHGTHVLLTSLTSCPGPPRAPRTSEPSQASYPICISDGMGLLWAGTHLLWAARVPGNCHCVPKCWYF